MNTSPENISSKALTVYGRKNDQVFKVHGGSLANPFRRGHYNFVLLFEVILATIAEALTVAIRHLQGGRLQAAEQIYRQILQVEPNHPDALHLLGVIASMAGKPELAIEYIGRALQRKPDNPEAHSNLGVALKEKGKLDEAVGCFRRALQLKPDFVDAHNNLGIAFMSNQKGSWMKRLLA